VLVSVALLRCRSEVPLAREDLPGRYTCNLPGPVQTLELRSDGTFVQTVGGADEMVAYTGDWTTDAPAAKVNVMLRPYHFYWPEHLVKPGTIGGWFAAARRISGAAALIVNDDEGLYCAQAHR
jgi:hypothetical protein